MMPGLNWRVSIRQLRLDMTLGSHLQYDVFKGQEVRSPLDSSLLIPINCVQEINIITP